MIKVEKICGELFGLEVTAKVLDGEEDLNYQVVDRSGRKYVLKLSAPGYDQELLELQNRVFHLLEKEAAGSNVNNHFPRIIPSRNGQDCEKLDIDDREYLARLLSFLPGKPAALVKPHSPRLLSDLGKLLASLDKTISGIDIPSSASRDFPWDLRQAREVIDRHLPYIDDNARRSIVEKLLWVCLPILDKHRDSLRLGLVHNDANDYNVMVSSGVPGELHISGLIDFGDMSWTWIVAEAAISAFYMTLDKADPVGGAAALVSGYNAEYPLSDEELAVVFPLICLRGCVSVCLSACRAKEQPDNEYLQISAAPAWRQLEKAVKIHPRLAEYRIRGACGKEPCPATSLLVPWLESQDGNFNSPVPVDLTSPAQKVLDLSVGSGIWNKHPDLMAEKKDSEGNKILFDSSESVSMELIKSGLTHLIGRYGEARLAFPEKRYRQNTDTVPEKKNIHLGIDIFLPPGTPVCAPLEGVVFSCSDNSRPLDYGPTVILRHQPSEGIEFFTLYGHLERVFLGSLSEGMKVGQGQQIGRVGAMEENGGWPPHLHFQVIADILDRKQSFPGVTSPGHKGTWLSISPDPNLMLGIPGELLETSGRPSDEILNYRSRHLGKSLSVSYNNPLKIVRGVGQYLYDQDGRQFLDCVNNVCHVGHSRPEVVKAGMEQAFTLNTNTRYLHDCLVEYTDALLRHFPAPLDTCFLVCSGSEANELALRLARTYTGAFDVIAVDGAYHGNTQTLIDISSYKHGGPGGKGAPSWAHIVPLPDGYRGKHKGSGAETGRAYADYVTARLEKLSAEGKKAACFICEALPGCGGQIVLPEDYLKNVYSSARRHGAVNIADEVQTGFGRVGSHFWGFEMQGVIPDIVTLGKPIGNGHPLAAVITTSEIADAFANGMEYFNTYGGNPVSCSIGKAVLAIIEQEHMQAHALDVGNYLMSHLGKLKEKHSLVGDVRGSGLFLGVELVLDHSTLEPAADHADQIINRMRELGILLSTDGPLHNVLKIKPPMVFSKENADHLADALDLVFNELESQA